MRRPLLVLLLGTPLLCLPALCNGYPFVDYDSMSYIQGGRQILGTQPFCWSIDARSVVYSITLAILQAHRSMWPAVIGQALLTAGLVTFSTLKLFPRASQTAQLLILASLTLATSAAVECDYLMPDIFTAHVIVGLYFLGPGRDRLSHRESVTMTIYTAFAITCHGSNWVLALLLIGLHTLRQRRWHTEMLVALLLASGMQVYLHFFLYRRLLLFATHRPFMLAREMSDGLLYRYMTEVPEASQFAMHAHPEGWKGELTNFLWEKDGLCSGLADSQPQELERINREEGALVARIALAFPVAQLHYSLKNWASQLADVDVTNRYPRAEVRLTEINPAIGSTPQAGRRIHTRLVSWCFKFIAALAFLALLRILRRPTVLAPLIGWVLLAVLLNAGVCGVLSAPEGRYGARVAWLVPWIVFLRILEAQRSVSDNEIEGGALADRAFRPDSTAVTVNNAPGDG